MAEAKPYRRSGKFRRRSWSRNFWTRWLQRRLPPTDQVRFGRHNLFIFPIREGKLFLVLLIIMLLTGINYQNSLIYMLTFLLGALFYAGILQTHANLSGVELSLVGVEEGFAGAPLAIRLLLKVSNGDDRPAVSVSADASKGTLYLRSGIPEEVALYVEPKQRGLHALPRLQVETYYPMGLFRAWSYIWLKTSVLVYPKPVEPAAYAETGHSDEEQKQLRPGGTASDELFLRPYRAGDSLQRVQWKRYARDGEMVVMEREPTSSQCRWLDYNDFFGVDPELRLSYLAWLVEDCHRHGQMFALCLPASLLPPAGGEPQRREALRRLALFEELPS